MPKRWIPFAKGGSYSPYYADIHLVVNWERGAEELKNFKDPQTGKAFSYLRNISFHFRPGLTWPIKNRFTFKPRPLNAGCIFAHVGATAFVPDETDLLSYQALLSSSIYTALLRLTSGWNFEVGAVQHTPIPNLSEFDKVRLGQLALASIDIKRSWDKANETSHIYHFPALLMVLNETLNGSASVRQRQRLLAEQQLFEYQHEIDDIAFQLYGITSEDRKAIEESLNGGKQAGAGEIDEEPEDDDGTAEASSELHSLVTDLVSYTIGCSFGRWDIRFATDERSTSELADPFAPLPICSPGMLTGDDGLPLYETPHGYPLEISWEDILVDDPDHQDDIVSHVQGVLKTIWQDRAEFIEQEACQILEVKELQEYFRKSGNGGFWMDHVRRCSKSRRKAPIYWLLQSAKRNYAIWIYYHRLDKDTLFKALTKYVEPKIRLEDSRLEQWRTQLVATGSEGREVKQLGKQLERQEGLVADLYDFRDKLRQAAGLNLEPDLNDGVVLNIAPLRELVPWSEAKKYWDELLAGKYEWSSISKQLRSKGVI